MINNRQAGRRRGRGGGQRQGGNPGRPDNGNRIDNRARGNAAQLLEKYKSLAADAQRSGDRVNTEYYLQFADHYFRVLSEQRGRFEEQNQQRRSREDFDDEDGEEFEAESRDERQDRNTDRSDRSDREERQQRRPYAQSDRQGERMNGRANGYERDDRPRQDEGERIDTAAQQPATGEDDRQATPRRRGRPPREQQAPVSEASPALEADRLPPALSRPESSNDDGEEAPRPRRRRTRPTEDEASQSAA